MGLADFLLGKKINTQNVEPSASYGQEVDEYLNTLGSQPYMQNLLNQPKEVGLTLKEYQRGVANGLNYGIPEIAEAQKQLGIRIPVTEEEKYNAQLGDFNQPQGMNINVSNVPRRGGALNNFITGFRENFNNGFSPSNLEPANKSFSTRFGEGVGSLARFANSPAGRGLLVAGLVGATGGGALPALAFGGSATLGNQQYRLNDKMYRDDLIRSGRQYIMNTPEYATADDKTKQAMLDEVDNRIKGYRGYINKDIYRNMIDSQIAQENAAYRRMYYDNQAKENAINNLLAQQKFDYQIGQDKIRNAIDWAKINADKQNKGTVKFSEISSLRKEFSNIPAIKNANEIKRQFGQVTTTYNSYKAGKLGANAADQTMVTTLNKILDPDSVVRESEFARTAAGQSLLARMEGYANKMTKGGGGLTDVEREDLYNAMQEMYNANQEEAQAYIESYTDLANRYNINPADIMPRQFYNSVPKNTGINSKYKEGDIAVNPKTNARMIYRGGKWINL